jgi:hypothetical protein
MVAVPAPWQSGAVTVQLPDGVLPVWSSNPEQTTVPAPHPPVPVPPVVDPVVPLVVDPVVPAVVEPVVEPVVVEPVVPLVVEPVVPVVVEPVVPLVVEPVVPLVVEPVVEPAVVPPVVVEPEQDVPLKVYAVGLGSEAFQVPWNPKVVEPPVASEPLYARLAAVTAVPDCVTVAFHAEVIFWSPPYVQPSVQLETAGPLLVTVTLAVKPPVHSLSE